MGIYRNVNSSTWQQLRRRARIRRAVEVIATAAIGTGMLALFTSAMWLPALLDLIPTR